MPFWNKKKKEQKEEKKEPVKQDPTATEKCCMDPKYFQNLTDEDKKILQMCSKI